MKMHAIGIFHLLDEIMITIIRYINDPVSLYNFVTYHAHM